MKKIITFLFIITIITTMTGCFKRDKMENIRIVTTIYPIEYVTNRLYGENAEAKSIYPRSSTSNSYKITDKQLKDYSNYDLFIYNGTSKEREYAKKMINNNRKLKIIDASYGLDSGSSSDIWFNPANILMIGQNIKDELESYISDPYMKKDLNTKFERLKIDITELETELRKTAENSANNTIVVADESLNFLEKYGFEVINLTKYGETKESNVEKATQLIAEKKINYIFKIERTKDYEILDYLKNNYNINIQEIKSLDTITEKDQDENEDYISITHANIDLIKNETYK